MRAGADFSSFLRCPVCGGTLAREGGSLYCAGETGRRHCYDIAAAGYVNLLPPGRGSNARTGDAAEMLAARTAFLSGGYYDAISDAAADGAIACLPAGRTRLTLLDAGCGEGYHTDRIARRVARAAGVPTEMCGLDASKRGAAAGARLARAAAEDGVRLCFAAGNIFSMPVADASLDAVFSLFAPIPAAEAARVLVSDGVLVVVSAAPEHLWELRCLLYDEPRRGGGSPAAPAGFAACRREAVRRTVHIPDAAALRALYTMTPFSRRTPPEGEARLAAAEELDVTVAADITVWKKEESGRSGQAPDR